jgi:iron complex transport system permease protein
VIFSKSLPFLHLDPGTKLAQTIIWDIRLPRLLLAIIAGAGLAAAGATMQGLLRNPLVSSYVLGISSAAGFGAALAIVFGISVVSIYGGYLIIGIAFVFCLLAMVMVYLIARVRGMSSETVILAGVAVGFLFSALLSLIQYTAPKTEAVNAIVFGLWGVFIMLHGITSFMSPYCWGYDNSHDVSGMEHQHNEHGEEVAVSLGVNSKRVLATNMILETVATASIIAFTGIIGFVDLIAPHIARMLIGNDYRYLIPCSAVLGAFMLLCADTVGRLIIMPTELPVGIVTSLLGVPFFIYLLANKRRQSFS